MTTIAYPYTGPFRAAALDWWLEDNIIVSRSPMTGSIQTMEFPGALWMVNLTLPAATHADRADVEGFFAGLRRSNRLALWHLQRPEPRGTLRGTPTVGTGGAAWGATSIPISGAVGATILRGDLFGIRGQLVMATAPVTLSGGTGTLAFSPPLRQAVTAGTSIVWDKPTTTFVLQEPFRARYEPGADPSVSISLVEAF